MRVESQVAAANVLRRPIVLTGPQFSASSATAKRRGSFVLGESETMSLSKQRAKQIVRETRRALCWKAAQADSRRKDLNALDLNPASILDAGTEDATVVYWLADR
jgi:hypothetical protein